MTNWTDHVATLDGAHLDGARAVRLLQHHVGEEPVASASAERHRWLCDEGHVHASVTLALLTGTRLLVCVAGSGERHGVHPDDPTRTTHEPSEEVTVRAVPLRAIEHVGTDVSYRPRGQEPVDVRITVTLAGIRSAQAQPGFCEDPDCDAEHGFDLLMERDVIELGGVDEEVEADLEGLMAFGAALSAAVAR